jgi:hypothetical protein
MGNTRPMLDVHIVFLHNTCPTGVHSCKLLARHELFQRFIICLQMYGNLPLQKFTFISVKVNPEVRDIPNCSRIFSVVRRVIPLSPVEAAQSICDHKRLPIAVYLNQARAQPNSTPIWQYGAQKAGSYWVSARWEAQSYYRKAT